MTEVIWISHRGYCEEGATENTKASFDAALRLGFTHLETDLRLTRDGVIVLHHDDELKRTYGSAGKISTLDWKDLEALRTPDHQTLLRLDDLYELYPAYQWTFDIKPPGDGKTLEALAEWIKLHKAQDWFETHVRFLLWNPEADKQARRILEKIMRLAREPECYRAGLASLLALPFLGGIQKGMTYSIPPKFAGRDLFSSRMVRSYHRRGARLLAYLPPTEELAKKAYSLGFDEILTNGRKYF